MFPRSAPVGVPGGGESRGEAGRSSPLTSGAATAEAVTSSPKVSPTGLDRVRGDSAPRYAVRKASCSPNRLRTCWNKPCEGDWRAGEVSSTTLSSLRSDELSS